MVFTAHAGPCGFSQEKRHKTYIIMGEPIPLARARHGQRRTWDSQKQLKFGAGIQILNQHSHEPPIEGPIHLNITFFMPIPKCSKKRQEEFIGTYHYCRPDISNLQKFYEDISNKICYHDDAQIAHVTALKIYDLEPRTEFTLIEL